MLIFDTGARFPGKVLIPVNECLVHYCLLFLY